MGIDAGFDMIPRLTRGAVDKNDWSSFIRQVREYYEKDQRVDVRPNYLLFTTGENPMLPFEGHKFLRFSSKISGSHAASTNTNSYIRTVTRIATAHFGSRVRPWDESVDQNGHYSWTEVHETIGSYEQVNHLVHKTGRCGADHIPSLTKTDLQCRLLNLSLIRILSRSWIQRCTKPVQFLERGEASLLDSIFPKEAAFWSRHLSSCAKHASRVSRTHNRRQAQVTF